MDNKFLFELIERTIRYNLRCVPDFHRVYTFAINCNIAQIVGILQHIIISMTGIGTTGI